MKNSGRPLDVKTLPDLWQLPVLDSLTIPPEAPNDGDRYRVLPDAEDAWETQDNKLAIWEELSQSWKFETCSEGTVLYDLDANDWRYVKTDGTWEQFDKIPLAISDVTGLQNALDDKASTTHAADHEEGGTDELTGDLTAVAKVNVEKDGADTKTNRTINFTEGENITITITEAGGKTNIEIASTGGATAEFVQNVFRIIGDVIATKKLAFDIESLVDPDTTITWTVQNADGTPAILEEDQIFLGLVQALTMIATNSITSGKIILTDSETDPLVNGEIQLNGTEIKAKSNDLVGKILLANENDTISIEGNILTLKEAFLL